MGRIGRLSVCLPCSHTAGLLVERPAVRRPLSDSETKPLKVEARPKGYVGIHMKEVQGS